MICAHRERSFSSDWQTATAACVRMSYTASSVAGENNDGREGAGTQREKVQEENTDM